VYGPYHIRVRYANGTEMYSSDKYSNGIKFLGENGWIWVTRGSYSAIDMQAAGSAAAARGHAEGRGGPGGRGGAGRGGPGRGGPGTQAIDCAATAAGYREPAPVSRTPWRGV
jgi:hypothetical protein